MTVKQNNDLHSQEQATDPSSSTSAPIWNATPEEEALDKLTANTRNKEFNIVILTLSRNL